MAEYLPNHSDLANMARIAAQAREHEADGGVDTGDLYFNDPTPQHLPDPKLTTGEMDILFRAINALNVDETIILETRVDVEELSTPIPAGTFVSARRAA